MARSLALEKAADELPGVEPQMHDLGPTARF